MNTFEQVSIDGHQMLLARGGPGVRGPLYSEVQCVMGNGHMVQPRCEQTDRND